MRKVIAIILATGWLSGCATPQDKSKDFLAQSEALFNACAKPFGELSFDERFIVNPIIHRAPVSTIMECYSSDINNAATASAYPHAGFVFAYTQELARINRLLDQEKIGQEVASKAYARAIQAFREAIAQGDGLLAAQQKADRRQFFNGLAAFGAVMAEQDRQRTQAAQANRPVVCTLSGVYVQNIVTCR